ncbi:MAG: sulfur globule protein precursor, partial [Hyphomicrobiaceae bacterium]
MTRIFLKGLALAALVGLSALTLPATAEAGRGWGGHGWGGHGYYGG